MKLIGLIAAATVLATSSAWAVSGVAVTPKTPDSMVSQTAGPKKKPDFDKPDFGKQGPKHGSKHDHGGKPGYGPKPGYGKPPSGWHQHKRRPSDWRRRGCIAIGPVWFCP